MRHPTPTNLWNNQSEATAPWEAEHPRDHRAAADHPDPPARVLDYILIVLGIGGIIAGSLGFQRLDLLNIVLSTCVYLVGGTAFLLGTRALRVAHRSKSEAGSTPG